MEVHRRFHHAHRKREVEATLRVLLTLQYLGTRYAGWQSQTNATAIQDVVETALTKMFGTFIRIEGAGRLYLRKEKGADRMASAYVFSSEPSSTVTALRAERLAELQGIRRVAARW